MKCYYYEEGFNRDCTNMEIYFFKKCNHEDYRKFLKNKFCPTCEKLCLGFLTIKDGEKISETQYLKERIIEIKDSIKNTNNDIKYCSQRIEDNKKLMFELDKELKEIQDNLIKLKITKQ